MNTIYKLFALGIFITTADAILMKADRKDIAFYMTLAGLVAGSMLVYPEIKKLFDMVQSMFPVY